jgi:DNA topoisomerase-3
LKCDRGKLYERTVASIIQSRIQNIQIGEVTNVSRTQLKVARPIGLNTVKMLKVASKTFGMSAHETMHVAEHLYLRGYITYPRSESTTFSPNFNFNEILEQHRSHPEWGKIASNLLNNGFSKPKKGVDAGDHPPITPVRSGTKDSLGDREWKLYSFITRTFLGCISDDAVYDQVKIMVQIGGESFKIKG